eukprot:scaffold96016_cov17-Tisochrysis_lutea.AAC.2
MEFTLRSSAGINPMQMTGNLCTSIQAISKTDGLDYLNLQVLVVTSAGATVTAAVTAIAPYILSWSEYGRAAFYAAQR